MIDKNKIKLAAQKWQVGNRQKKHDLSDAGFIAGAYWALSQLDELCNDAANVVEQLQLENARLKDEIASARSNRFPCYGENVLCSGV